MIESDKSIYAINTCLVILLSGCASNAIQKVEAPKQIEVLSSSYSATQKNLDETRYNELIQAGNLSAARAMRDVIVQSIRNEIEIVYKDFESGLFANKAAFEVQTDIFELFLSTATTLTGAPRARTNLSALLTGTKGSRLSVDKNVFGEKTYSALVSQMRASRSKASANIFEKLTQLDVISYPLKEAEIDLNQLFNAGTLHEALIQLTTQAGSAAETQAQNEAKMAHLKLDTATQEQVDQITSIRSRFNDLYKEKDITTARKILKVLDPTVKNDLADADVWNRLNSQILKANDKSYLPTLNSAFIAH